MAHLVEMAQARHQRGMSDQVSKIRIRGLHKRFGAKHVLDGIDLDVASGTSMVVIGGSGSGKSVLIKCILGLIEPDAGVIEIDGRDVLTMSREERTQSRARIGMLFQNGALFDSLPVWENVAFGLLARHSVSRAEARGKAEALMDSGNPAVDQFTHGLREGPIQMELRR